MKGLILKLTAFQNLSIWAFRKRRALRYNLFCGKKSHKKGFPLQSLTQNAVVTRIKPIETNFENRVPLLFHNPQMATYLH
jgi:hypothetical protein